MKQLLIILSSIMMLSSCAKERLIANGDKISETRNLNEFNAVRISGSSTIKITYGNEYKVVLKGSSNLVPYLKSTINDRILKLSYEHVNVNADDVEIEVTMPILTSTTLSGSARVHISGNFPTLPKLELDLSGSGDISVMNEINIDQLVVGISGSGNVNSQKAISHKVDINISGSGNARVQVIDFLKVRISGSGEIYYTGSPDVDSKVSGSGKIFKF